MRQFTYCFVLFAVLWSSIANAQCQDPRWVYVAGPPSPYPVESAMVFDSARGRIVFFGGMTHMQTWEFDGQNWTQFHVPGPSRNSRVSLAYDSVAGRVVLFGGHNLSIGCAGYASDTWLWDGAQWTQASPSTPPSGRTDAAMAFDPVRNRTVLFGGSPCGQYLSDTWEFDGAQWQQIPATGPTARRGAAMVYDPDHQTILLYGGTSGAGVFQDLWSWNGTAWTLMSNVGYPSGPPGRANAVLVHDPDHHRIVVCTGNSGSEAYGYGYNSDLWEWDGTAWNVRTFSAHGGALGVYDTPRHRLLTYGGLSVPGDSTTPKIGNTWSWNGTTWTLTNAGVILSRTGHQMAYDPVRDQVVLFGGASTGDTLTWSQSTGWRTATTAGPAARSNFAMAWDAATQRVVLYGGIAYAGNPPPRLSDTWLWNGTAWQQQAITGPPARSSMGTSYDAARGRVVIHGGTTTGDNSLSETWEYTGAAWVQYTGNTARALIGPSMSYDPWRTQTAMFGGGESWGFNYWDTWGFNGASWWQSNHTGPGPMQGIGLAPGPGQRMILGAASGGTWEWDGQAWTLRTASPGPTGGAMTYDSFRNWTLMQGASSSSGVADYEALWAYVQPDPPQLSRQPSSAGACSGRPLTFTVAAISADPVQYQWRHDALPIQGADGPTLTITAIPANQGVYDCVLTNLCGSTTSASARLTVMSADFNNDSDTGTDVDIMDFFACLAGNCCPACAGADFNGDGDIGTDTDIQAFFQVLAGNC